MKMILKRFRVFEVTQPWTETKRDFEIACSKDSSSRFAYLWPMLSLREAAPP